MARASARHRRPDVSNGRPGSPEEQPLAAGPLGFPEALELTARTINLRATGFKHIAIAVVAVCIVALVWAAVAGDWPPLAGLVLLLPLCAIFVHRDAAAVSRWRSAILASWAEARLDLGTFRAAMRSVPSLPTATLQAMLATLPELDGVEVGFHSPVVRRAVAVTLQRIEACASDRRTAATLARLAVAGFLAWALVERSWWPTAGLLTLPPIYGVGWVASMLRFRGWRHQLALFEQDGLDLAAFVATAHALNWRGVSPSHRHRLFALLTPLEARRMEL